METINIIKLGENNIQDIDIINAIVSVAEKNDFGYFYNLSKSYVIALSKNSSLANSMLENPTKEFSIDMNDFSLRRIKFDDIDHEFGYLHIKLIDEINSQKSIGQKATMELEDSLNDCLFSCHAEMFFYFLLKVVFIREFEKKSDNINNLFERFKDVMSVIVMDVYKIKHDNFDNLDDNQILKIKDLYADALDYLPDFADSIRSFVVDNFSAQEVSRETLGDAKYNYSNYIQKIIIKAIEITERRIVVNRKSTEYFGHEITITPSNVQLKIFSTLKGYEEFQEVSEKWNEGQLLIDYLSRNNFEIINDEEIVSEMKTRWVLKHSEIINPFYNDRKNTLSYSSFNKQQRSKFFNCIFNQGQINLTLLKS